MIEMASCRACPDHGHLGAAFYATEILAGLGMQEGGLGHKCCEEYRVLPDKSTPEAQSIAQQSRDHYDAVRAAVKGGG